MDRCGLTRETRWCQACSSTLSSLEVIHEKHYPQQTIFLSLVTSRTYITTLTANLRAQIDSGDPGLSFVYLPILVASIVITSERAQRAERVLSYLREKSEAQAR